ncbi:alpha/beta hydrolase [Actinomycetospora endophytica]|uniref:Alpha/beta hydrolase n=1 Tax=Actinomycetospora endophytica TaxID=2291215 RepID=A0ABS8PKZ3_9PSEU|nr:alpha/beta hydrolase [Actinomycetospora endophytica]MCD2198071.1 alpha/beta hydrolase [Actinomycetospora endophytica]
MLDRDFWEPDVRPHLEAYVAAAGGGRGDVTDPALLAALRDPGPDPAPEPGVTWSAATIPNTAGDHDVPVRVYRPEHPDPRRPAYVLFHGGGLSFGHLNTEHRRCVELTRACGAVGVSVDYRMAPEHAPAVILDDAYSALRHVATHAEDYDVDPRRIVLTGSSGGGMLTLALAQLVRDRGEFAPMLQLALYPNTDDRRLPEHVSRRTDLPVIPEPVIQQVMRNLVPSEPPAPYIVPNRTEDLTGLCPALVLVGQNDPLRDEAIHYSWRLVRAGVPTELHVLPGLPHGFDAIAPDADATRTAHDLMNHAVRRASSGPDPGVRRRSCRRSARGAGRRARCGARTHRSCARRSTAA